MTPPDAAAFAAADAAIPLADRPYPRGFLASLRKYGRICRASLVERLTYRVDFMLGILFRFLPMLTTILLWKAIYAGASSDRINGFSYREMIAYLLLTNISRMFSSMPGLAGGVARDIRDGAIKRYLIQPIDMIGYLVAYRIAHKISYIITSAVPYAILFWICRDNFDGLPDPLTLLAWFASLVMAFVVGFFFEVSVGMVGFWIGEVTSILYIVMTLNFFISGHMLPLDLLPEPWFRILTLLPFQYMAYFPAVVFQGKIHGPALAWGLAGQFAWAVAFILIARGLFRLGLRRYSAFGG
ncbi:MAG: ABC-2 family transporter protein [Isosphaeraceae bacterium]|nr:ABC-2 family transporter protein [Isosphaeraceae bacterium]